VSTLHRISYLTLLWTLLITRFNGTTLAENNRKDKKWY